MTKLSAGVVGLSEGIYHLEAYASSPDVGRIVLCDPDTHVLDTIRKQFPKVGAVYRHVEEMLLHERLDVASVATSDETYLDCATAILDASVNLLLAKPFANNLNAAEAIVRSAAEMGVKIMIAHETRFRPRFAKIREMVDTGFFGEIIHIRLDGVLHARQHPPGLSSLADDPDRIAPGGPIQEIDLLRFLVGEEVVGVSAISNKPSPLAASSGGAVCALFRFVGGCIGQTTIDTGKQGSATGSMDDRFRLIGSKGIAVGHKAYADGFNAWTALQKDENEVRTGTHGAVDSFIRSLTLGTPVAASGEDALTSLRLREAVDRALTSETQIFMVT